MHPFLSSGHAASGGVGKPPLEIGVEQLPPPRFHSVRYHGVLAPAARFRAQVVSESPDRAPARACHRGCPGRDAKDATAALPGSLADRAPRERNRPRPRNYSWAELMHRVWAMRIGKSNGLSGPPPKAFDR